MSEDATPPAPSAPLKRGTCRWARHAESEANRLGADAVGKDSCLSDLGRQQAQTLTGHYDVVIVSSLRRSRETLEHSQCTYGQLIVSDLCREMLGGSVSDYLDHEDHKTLRETPRQGKQRYGAFVRKCKELTDKGLNVLVITHYCFVAMHTGHRLSNTHSFIHPLEHVADVANDAPAMSHGGGERTCSSASDSASVSP
jgi:broad specificity phosphatase PhoE